MYLRKEPYLVILMNEWHFVGTFHTEILKNDAWIYCIWSASSRIISCEVFCCPQPSVSCPIFWFSCLLNVILCLFLHKLFSTSSRITFIYYIWILKTYLLSGYLKLQGRLFLFSFLYILMSPIISPHISSVMKCVCNKS